MLSRDEILAARDHTIEEVNVPEWGGIVYVRGVSGVQRDKFELLSHQARQAGKKMGIEADPRGLLVKLVIASICDENGELVFTEQDAEALNEKSALALQRVYSVALRLSSFSEQDIKALAGNLASDRSENSGSD